MIIYTDYEGEDRSLEFLSASGEQLFFKLDPPTKKDNTYTLTASEGARTLSAEVVVVTGDCPFTNPSDGLCALAKVEVSGYPEIKDLQCNVGIYQAPL